MQNNTETSRQQILLFGEAESTCSPEVFPASRFRSQANAREQRMNATCGPKCLEQFSRFVPAGSWARTFSELLIGRKEWSSNKCALTWKLKGTKSNRLYFRLVPSALPTEGTDAGLLPTVQTQGLKQCEKGKTVFMPLELLPTPRGSDGQRGPAKLTDGMSVRKSGKAFSAQLTDLSAAWLLPTPTAIDAGSGRINRSTSQGAADRPTIAMAARMGMLPTPRAGDYQSPGQHGEGGPDLITAVSSPTGTTSRLNPLFVAEMMGFPTDWTVLPFLRGAANRLKGSATPSCRR